MNKISLISPFTEILPAVPLTLFWLSLLVSLIYFNYELVNFKNLEFKLQSEILFSICKKGLHYVLLRFLSYLIAIAE